MKQGLFFKKRRTLEPAVATSMLVLLAAFVPVYGTTTQGARVESPEAGRDASAMIGAVKTSGTSGRQATTVRSPRGALAIGDRVRIEFHELIDVPSASRLPGAGSTLRTVFTRKDLSGEYVVEADGSMSLPRIGTINVGGRSMKDLRQDLATAFSRRLGRPADVNVSIVERQPVYVLGAVKNAGPVKFVPDMIVLQALSLAGGLRQFDGSSAELIGAVRETERANMLSDRLKRLISRKARLEAQWKRSDAVAMPAELVALTGNQDAQVMMDTELLLLKLEQSRHERERSQAITVSNSIRTEIGLLEGQVEELDRQREMRNEHLQDMKQLKSSGMLRRRSFIATSTELNDLNARRLAVLGQLSAAKARLADAERQKEQVHVQYASGLIKDLSEVDAQISQVRLSLESARRLTSHLRKTSGTAADMSSAELVFNIVRLTADGRRTFEAEETTPLQPGDVLKVTPRIMEHGKARPASAELHER
ncbi:MAG: hypothetical protein RLZ98_2732 [Pseudomonadota bacterium]|jgi:protein involved in polysaccharide export with SLBB domain